MATPDFRLAGPDDIPALAAMRSSSEDECRREESRIARYLAGEHHPHMALEPRVVNVACADDTPVGFIAGHLTRRYACDGELQWLHVLPEQRRTGVATRLLHTLAAWFAEQGAARICVDVDPANNVARRFYRKCGAVDLNEHWLVWEDIRQLACAR